MLISTILESAFDKESFSTKLINLLNFIVFSAINVVSIPSSNICIIIPLSLSACNWFWFGFVNLTFILNNLLSFSRKIEYVLLLYLNFFIKFSTKILGINSSFFLKVKSII